MWTVAFFGPDEALQALFHMPSEILRLM